MLRNNSETKHAVRLIPPFAMLPLLLLMSACGALAAAANPRTIWVIQEKAPLVVVVDRASAAQSTEKEVDRLLTATATNGTWLDHLEPNNERIQQIQRDQAARAMYDSKQPYKIVPAVIWAKSLASVETAPPNAPEPAAEPQTQPPSEPPAVPTIGKPDADASVAANALAAGGSSSAKELSAAPPDSPLEAGVEAAAATAPEPAPAAATEATTPPAPRSLFATISLKLEQEYAKLVDTIAQVDRVRAQIDAERKAGDTPGLTDAQRKAHEATVELKERELERAKDAVEPAQQTFIASCKPIAMSTTADARARAGRALVSLRAAVEDAKDANGAAVAGYPFAVPDLKNQVILAAKTNLTDFVFERTGARLQLQSLQLGVKLDGTKVRVEINGVSAQDLGKIAMDELVKETVARTETFVEKSAALLATASETEKRLSFEADVIDALVDGFKARGWAPPSSESVPEADALAIRASVHGKGNGLFGLLKRK